MSKSQEMMRLVDDLLFNRIKFNHKRTTEENKIKLEQVYWHDKAKLQAMADRFELHEGIITDGRTVIDALKEKLKGNG